MKPHSIEEEHVFKDVDTKFKGAIVGVLEDSIVDAYIMVSTHKKMWDALKVKYRVFDVACELYVVEQFHDYREQFHDYIMVVGCYVASS